ncbi:MAG: heat shock protein DnaJ-like protein [Acidobacteria bacterium]|nr:heat shock protein DnaJ-like protein [Acidobacteriota bacterium]
MSSDSRSLVLESCRHCGAGAPAEVHFCPQCDRILSLARHGDYFLFFGLPRKLNIDLADLERRFRDLSRQFHPDYFYNASPGERLASLERSSYLNDAYRVLRQPIDRVEYLLKLEGLAPVGRQQPASQDPELLERVFAMNEELDQVRAARAAGAAAEEVGRRLEAARRPIEARAARQDERLAALMAQWDAVMDGDEAGLKPCSTGADGGGAALQGCSEKKRQTLEALRGLLQERSYVANLLQLVARESGGI